ncbi:MAG: hypothetical protein OEV95_12220, partial [Gemmatimonadota bacterium]|nr:hypothetical protein [Gemmatimonadota bacterium]
MPQTVEVRFKGLRREFFLWPDGEEPLRLKDAVVVEIDKGQDLGRVTSTGEAAIRKCGGCTSCGSGAPEVQPSEDAPAAPAHPPAPEGLPRVIRRAS